MPPDSAIRLTGDAISVDQQIARSLAKTAAAAPRSAAALNVEARDLLNQIQRIARRKAFEFFGIIGPATVTSAVARDRVPISVACRRKPLRTLLLILSTEMDVINSPHKVAFLSSPLHRHAGLSSGHSALSLAVKRALAQRILYGHVCSGDRAHTLTPLNMRHAVAK